MLWHDEMISHLRELLNDGLSFGAIAKVLNLRFGVSLTRNACIGKAHRNGLYNPTKPRQPARHRGPRERRIKLTPPRVLAPIDMMYTNRRTLLELTNDSCRWPIGDPRAPDFFFCGGHSDNQKGQPYCDYHTALAGHRPNRKAGDTALEQQFGIETKKAPE
jgi:GcrA cell cycle regulator